MILDRRLPPAVTLDPRSSNLAEGGSYALFGASSAAGTPLASNRRQRVNEVPDPAPIDDPGVGSASALIAVAP